MKPLKNILLLLLLLASCGSSERGRMLAVLDEADSLNRNYIPFTTDSALKIATEWFDSHGSANERVRAHYLLGCAYRDMGEAPAALQSYHDAVDCADTTSTDCDYRLLCRVYSQIAYVFHEQYMPNSELRMLDNAIKYAYLSGDTLLALNCQENKIGSYYQLNNNDSVIAISWEMNRKYKEAGNIKRSSLCLGTALFLVLRQGHYEDTKKVLTEYTRHSDIFRQNGEVLPGYELLYYVKGMYFLGTNQLDSSKYYLNKMFKNKLDINSTKAAYEGLYKYYAHIHQYDSAAKYSELYTALNDSSYMRMTTNQLAHLQCMYDYTRHQQLAERKTQEAERSKVVILFLLLISILIMVLLSYIYKVIKYRQNEAIRIYNSNYNQIKETYEKTKLEVENLQLKSSEDNSLIAIKKKEIEELKASLSEYMEYSDYFRKRREKKKVYDSYFINELHHQASCGIEAFSTDFRKLTELMEKNDKDFLNVLSTRFVNCSLTPKEIRIIMLIRLHFLPTEIAVLLNTSIQSITNSRKRLLVKMFGKTGGAKDFDREIQQL